MENNLVSYVKDYRLVGRAGPNAAVTFDEQSAQWKRYTLYSCVSPFFRSKDKKSFTLVRIDVRLEAIEDINAGEEIYVDLGYENESPELSLLSKDVSKYAGINISESKDVPSDTDVRELAEKVISTEFPLQKHGNYLVDQLSKNIRAFKIQKILNNQKALRMLRVLAVVRILPKIRIEDTKSYKRFVNIAKSILESKFKDLAKIENTETRKELFKVLSRVASYGLDKDKQILLMNRDTLGELQKQLISDFIRYKGTHDRVDIIGTYIAIVENAGLGEAFDTRAKKYIDSINKVTPGSLPKDVSAWKQ